MIHFKIEMPEGPELKITRDNLIFLEDNYINNLIILSGRYKKKIPEYWKELTDSLPLKIINVEVKGKLLYFILENNWIILNTMGMSGRWTKQLQKHCHIELVYNNTEKIWFCDIRRFGTIKILKSMDLLETKLNSLGPDMLNSNIKCSEFIEIMRKHNKKNITKVLMNQSIISGVGNYIKSESLYDSNISPHNNIIDIDEDRLIKLFHSIRKIMNLSYLSQGATISTYYNINDEIGDFSFKVYARKHDDEGKDIIREKTLDGRTSYWVKDIQY